MSDSFILAYELTINNYLIKLYGLDHISVDIAHINDNLLIINTLDTPKKLVEYLQEINGVSKIEILDQDNNLILNSSQIIL